jgi:hypothetical protein
MAVRFGMTIAEIIAQLTRGFRSVAGRAPDGLEKIKIQQEAVQRFKEMNKVVDMQGRTLDPSKPIMGGTQEGAALRSGIMKATGAKPISVVKKNLEQTAKVLEANQKRKLNTFKNLDDNKKLTDDEYQEFLDEIGGEDRLEAYEFDGTAGSAKKILKKEVDYEQSMFDQYRKGKLDPEDMAQGGRAGFKIGSIDKARRAFLKTVGAVGAGIGALKTGILGLTKGAAPVATEAVKSAGSTASAPPPYFFKLMEKIKLLGEPRRSPSYRERVKEYQYTGKDGNEYLLTEELDTGDIMIQKDKIGGRSFEEGTYEVIEDRTEMVFRKGQMDETTKGKKPPDEYEEYKVEFDQDGTAADATDIDEISKMEIVEEAGDPDSLTLKKAGGGIARMLGE